MPKQKLFNHDEKLVEKLGFLLSRKSSYRFISMIALLFSSAVLLAEERSNAVVYLHAGQVLDVKTGSYQSDVLISIENGLIKSIDQAAEKSKQHEWVDLTAYTLLPGLMDVHTHLTDNTYMGSEFDHWALPAASFGIVGVENAKKTLEAGFTTVRDVSGPYYADVALRDAINAGWIPGPTMYVSGQMITMTGGHGDWGNWMAAEHQVETSAEVVADGVDEVRKAVRKHILHGVDLIKLSATGGFYTSGSMPGAATYSQAEIQAAVDEAAKRGMAVAAHAHGEAGILNAVAAGVKSIEHNTLMGDAALKQLKKQGVFVVMDLLAAHFDLVETNKDFTDKDMEQGNQGMYEDYADRFNRAYQAGIRMAFGSDAGIYPHGRNAEQFKLMVDAGMEPIDAIRSATIWAAELIGIEKQVGQLQAGMKADLIAVKGDPIKNINLLTDIKVIMQAGKWVKHP